MVKINGTNNKLIFIVLLCKVEEFASAYILAVKTRGMEHVRVLANCAPWLSVADLSAGDRVVTEL